MNRSDPARALAPLRRAIGTLASMGHHPADSEPVRAAWARVMTLQAAVGAAALRAAISQGIRENLAPTQATRPRPGT